MNKIVISAILAGVLIAATLLVIMPLERVSTIHPRTITGALIPDGSITTAKIADGTITTTDISGTAGITGAQIADGTITTTDISGTAGITGAQIADGTIATADILANAVTSAKIPTFVSGIITGTGVAQNTAHGLTGTPTVFFAFLVNDPSTTVCSITVTSADGTNLTATVPLTCQYRWFAIAP